MTSYRPVWAVSLTLHFDETMNVVQTPIADEFGAVQSYDASKPGTDVVLGPSGARLTPPKADPGLEPLVLRRGQTSQFLYLQPKTASVEVPATRACGKFKFTFPYKDIPIDPRIVRSASVEVFLASVSDDTFASSITGPNGTTRIARISPTVTGGAVNQDNLVMAGFIDTWAVEHGEKSSEIAFEGRDFRGYFMDGKPPAAGIAKLDLRKSIDQVVAQILSLCPFGALFQVVADPNEWPRGALPSPGTADGATRVTLGAKGAGGQAPASGAQAPGQAPSSASSTPSAWDLIVQYAFIVGAVPYFEGKVLRIRPARTYFDLRQAGLDAEAAGRRLVRGNGPALPTPFKDGLPRDVGEDTPLRLRRVVYGRDINTLAFERKFGGFAKTPTIEVVGIDDTKRGAQKLLLVQWPPKEATAARQTKLAPGGEVAQTDTLRIPVHGIRSKERLLAVAKSLYEEIARQEITGKGETQNMNSQGGDATDPDLVRLRTGDAIEILVDTRTLASRAPLVAELVDHTRRSFAEEVAVVKAAIKTGDENLARALVASARSSTVDQLRTFKIVCAKYDLDATGKTKIGFEFQNYVTVRQQVDAEVQRSGKKAPITRAPGRTQTKKILKVVKQIVNNPAAQKVEKIVAQVFRMGGGGK